MNQNRRKFITNTAAGSAALLMSSLDSFSLQTQPNMDRNKNYELQIMATDWGFDGTFDAFCAKAKNAGYDGVEAWWPTDNKAKQDELFSTLKKYNLSLGILCGGSQEDPQAHLEYYKKMIDAAARQTIQRPLYINNHSGRDH